MTVTLADAPSGHPSHTSPEDRRGPRGYSACGSMTPPPLLALAECRRRKDPLELPLILCPERQQPKQAQIASGVITVVVAVDVAVIIEHLELLGVLRGATLHNDHLVC